MSLVELVESADWDRRFESDAKSGRLDAVFKQAEADHDAGKSREI